MIQSWERQVKLAKCYHLLRFLRLCCRYHNSFIFKGFWLLAESIASKQSIKIGFWLPSSSLLRNGCLFTNRVGLFMPSAGQTKGKEKKNRWSFFHETKTTLTTTKGRTAGMFGQLPTIAVLSSLWRSPPRGVVGGCRVSLRQLRYGFHQPTNSKSTQQMGPTLSLTVCFP